MRAGREDGRRRLTSFLLLSRQVLTGGHKESEITSLVYSAKFSLLASGSANGRIAIWEFETGRLENILIAREKGDITSLKFGEPYPILISGGSGGVVNVWGIKGCVPAFKYKCIGKQEREKEDQQER